MGRYGLLLLLLLLLCMHETGAFISSGGGGGVMLTRAAAPAGAAATAVASEARAQGRVRARSSSTVLGMSTPAALEERMPMTPRRMQFFNKVEEGLADFPEGSVDRIYDFVKYCKGDLIQEPQGELHQPIEEFVAGLAGKPWWDKEDFPWVGTLEEKSQVVQDEFREFMVSPLTSFLGDSVQMDVMGEGWSGVRLQRNGRWLEENCERFPKTVSLLRDLEIPLAMRGIIIAKQRPQSGVNAHSDGRNFVLTCHLGVDVPEGECWMKVGGQKKEWENGKAVILDTSFEHETGNESEKESRYVLIIDFWHPELSTQERQALQFVYSLRNAFESGQVPVERAEDPQESGVMMAFKGLFGGNKKK